MSLYEGTSSIANLCYPVIPRHGQRASVIASITEHGLRTLPLIFPRRVANFSGLELWVSRSRTVSVSVIRTWLDRSSSNLP